MKIINGSTAQEIKENTEEYLNLINDGAKSYIKIEVGFYETPNNPIILTEDDIDMSGGITITDILNPDIDLTFGKVVSKEIVMYVLENDKTRNINWNYSMRLSMGIEVNNNIKWVVVSTFWGTVPNRIINNGALVYTYTGYDYITAYDKIADDFISTLVFPCSIRDIFTGIESIYGNTIQVLTGTNLIDYQINSNPFTTGCTYRQILSWCAECMGVYITTNITGGKNLLCDYFRRPGYNIQYTLTRDAYFNIGISEVSINSCAAIGIIDSSDSNNDYYYPSVYSGEVYKIVDNPIINAYSTLDKDNVLSYIKQNRLTFFDSLPTAPPYIPMNVTAIGNWMVDTGDIIDVEDWNGNIVKMRVFARTLKWNGACTDYYECTGNLERKAVTNFEKTQHQTNTTITNRIVDSLSFGTKGMALDASQGQILNNSISALSDKVDVIGTMKSNNTSGTINCSGNSKSAGCSITITPGTWVVCANATINKCVSGTRQGLTVTTNSANGQYNRYCYELHNSPGTTTANQYYSVSRIWKVTANTTLYVMLYNGNVSTSYEASIDATRIL